MNYCIINNIIIFLIIIVISNILYNILLQYNIYEKFTSGTESQNYPKYKLHGDDIYNSKLCLHANEDDKKCSKILLEQNDANSFIAVSNGYDPRSKKPSSSCSFDRFDDRDTSNLIKEFGDNEILHFHQFGKIRGERTITFKQINAQNNSGNWHQKSSTYKIPHSGKYKIGIIAGNLNHSRSQPKSTAGTGSGGELIHITGDAPRHYKRLFSLKIINMRGTSIDVNDELKINHDNTFLTKKKSNNYTGSGSGISSYAFPENENEYVYKGLSDRVSEYKNNAIVNNLINVQNYEDYTYNYNLFLLGSLDKMYDYIHDNEKTYEKLEVTAELNANDRIAWGTSLDTSYWEYPFKFSYNYFAGYLHDNIINKINDFTNPEEIYKKWSENQEQEYINSYNETLESGDTPCGRGPDTPSGPPMIIYVIPIEE